jgi:ATP10 protein
MSTLMIKYNFTHVLMSFALSVFLLACLTHSTTKKLNMPFDNTDRNVLINTSFPELKAQTLSKQDRIFPRDVAGKPTIICIAFEGAAQSLVDTWTTPTLAKFPNSEVNYYEIPMIKTGYKFMRGFIDGGMRSGVPKDLHKNVATYYGDLSAYKKTLMMNKKESCYMFLLDKSGIIQYVSEGVADADKLTKVYGIIEQILAKN